MNVLLLFLWLTLPIVVLGSVIAWSASRNIGIGLICVFCLARHPIHAAGVGRKTKELELTHATAIVPCGSDGLHVVDRLTINYKHIEVRFTLDSRTVTVVTWPQESEIDIGGRQAD